METDRLPGALRRAVEGAVEGAGGRVTVGDVAAGAGVGLGEAEQALRALSLDAGGSLQVSGDGELVYSLPPDFKRRVAGKSLRVRLEPVAERAGAALSYASRVAFGTCLIVSVVLVTTTLLIIASSSRQSNDNRRDDRGYGGGGGFYMGPRFYFSPFDLFWYFDPYYYRTQRRTVRAGKGMDFLPSIFSFVFGDGDPNFDLEERRWETVGALIRREGGVVVAEQLAPYLDPPAGALELGDEAFVLPALQRFDGEANVDAEGRIFYEFPSLMTTGKEAGAAGRRGSGGVQAQDKAPEPYLYEEPFEFSAASQGQKLAVAALGAFNFVAIAALNVQLADPQVLRMVAMSAPGIAKLTLALLPFLNTYAVSFFAIPGVRFLANKFRNEKIQGRNRERVKVSARLLRDQAVQRKLASARSIAQKGGLKQVRQSDIIFDSSSDAASDRDALEDFDRRLMD